MGEKPWKMFVLRKIVKDSIHNGRHPPQSSALCLASELRIVKRERCKRDFGYPFRTRTNVAQRE